MFMISKSREKTHFHAFYFQIVKKKNHANQNNLLYGTLYGNYIRNVCSVRKQIIHGNN